MPVSVTAMANRRLGRTQYRVIRRPSFGHLTHGHGNVSLGGELKRIRKEILEDLLQSLRIRKESRRQCGVDVDAEGKVPGFGNVMETSRSTLSRIAVNAIGSASTVTVPDSIFERSRMSLIRVIRSVPAEWMLRGIIDLFSATGCLPHFQKAAGPG